MAKGTSDECGVIQADKENNTPCWTWPDLIVPHK
jgi:hypothetical protein